MCKVYIYINLNTHTLSNTVNRSVGLMRRGFSPSRGSDVEAMCRVLSSVYEFAELPVRHNEEELNSDLASTLSWPVDPSQLGDPHIKTFLLLQAHFERKALPISDYVNDTKVCEHSYIVFLPLSSCSPYPCLFSRCWISHFVC